MHLVRSQTEPTAEDELSPLITPKSIRFQAVILAAVLVLVALPLATCRAPANKAGSRIGAVSARTGDEIMIAGQLIHTGAPVVLWFDPGGYDAYRVERRFAPPAESGWDMIRNAIGSPNRYGTRRGGLDEAGLERVRGGGWTLGDVQQTVDQFVLHYDASGTSRQCFKVLHDLRGLSVHFLLDIDGTIYQTLDVKDRAWHATRANDRSVGVEIAQIGAYESLAGSPLADWYRHDSAGTRIRLPDWMAGGGVRTPGYIGRPASSKLVSGEVNGRSVVQYDFTDEQYESLIRLTAALCSVLPGIRCEYPRGPGGEVLDRAMTEEEFELFSGVLGHWHVQQNKVDPGPAFDWDRVRSGARRLMKD